MEKINELKIEHNRIEEYLDHLEKIMEDSNINYSDLIDTLAGLRDLWDRHEKKEEEMFDILKNEGNSLSFSTMLIEKHKELREHWRDIEKALVSGDEYQLMIVLDTDGRVLIDKLRNHIIEENILFDKSIITN
jgi:hypothetical protein